MKKLLIALILVVLFPLHASATMNMNFHISWSFPTDIPEMQIATGNNGFKILVKGVEQYTINDPTVREVDVTLPFDLGSNDITMTAFAGSEESAQSAPFPVERSLSAPTGVSGTLNP